MGPQAGRKVLTACAARCKQSEEWEEDDYGTGQLGKVGGFLLHAGVAVNTQERKKLERICLTISRPALSAGTIGADRSGPGQLCLENSVSGWDDWAAFRTLCSIGAAFRRWIGTRSLYGLTGSAGGQASNELSGPPSCPWGQV